jgi:2-oxoglutarate dehydrogenase complex dehydrogenase (E1) component-like enzyme
MSATPKSVDAKLGMQEQWDTSMLGGANSAWLESQYEQYLRDPNSVDEQWQNYFASLPMVALEAQQSESGVVVHQRVPLIMLT